MKEFIDKLISRLEEEKNRTYFVQTANPQMQRRYSHYGQSVFDKAISIVNQLAESYHIHCEQEYMRGYADAKNQLAEEYKNDISQEQYRNGYADGWHDCASTIQQSAPYTEGE